MLVDDEINKAFGLLWSDIKTAETFPEKRPLLAHYTSIATLESIMANDELWFSNPLFMNDFEELRFGILESAQAFRRHAPIKAACGSLERYDILIKEFENQLDRYSNQHAFDTYVLCFSEHKPENTDGVLSMWRGYGGNGNGAAIVFDTSKLQSKEGSPFIFSKVSYASRDERLQWIDNKLNEFGKLLINNDIPDNKLYIAVYQLLERIKIFSLFTKHHGFFEEQEWRAVYLLERDHTNKIDEMLHYAVGRQGIEPKLKYKVKPIEGLTEDDISLEKIVHQIILGPSVSNPLALSALRRMLEKNKKPDLAKKLVASTTPFRAM